MAASSASGGDRTLGRDGFEMDGLPSMPKRLNEQEQAIWGQLLEQLPPTLLRKIDTHQLATLVELLAMKDRLAGFVKADATDLKSTRLYIQTSQQINRLSAMFGLDPVSRARLKLPLDMVDPNDPFAMFLERRSGRIYRRDEVDEWEDS